MSEAPKLRLAFLGSPDFSVPALAALIDAGHDVACVYAQPPRPAGRGHKDRPCPVHAWAAEAGLEVRTPRSLRDDDVQAEFAALDLDAAVVVAYGLILPPAILSAPRLGCINVHASLLPRWRGAAPIQRAIEAGDTETGISIMLMDEGLDTGPVFAERRTPIAGDETGGGLHDRLSAMGALMLSETLQAYAAGNITPEPQPADGVTYARKLGKGEGVLDFTRPALDLDRQIRALSPWPGASFALGDQRIKVDAAGVLDDKHEQAPGTVLDDKLTIACGIGVLRPTRLQRPGKSMVEVDAFMRGTDIPPGTVLG